MLHSLAQDQALKVPFQTAQVLRLSSRLPACLPVPVPVKPQFSFLDLPV